jgi:hypothetical protein
MKRGAAPRAIAAKRSDPTVEPVAHAAPGRSIQAGASGELRATWFTSTPTGGEEKIMNASQTSACPGCRYELRFRSLFNEGRGYAFPCDARGQVNMDTLSERARLNYLYARIGIGREFSVPAVERRDNQSCQGWNTPRL